MDEVREKMPDSAQGVAGSFAPITAPTQYVPSSSGKLAGVDPQSILDRVAAGELLRDIAAEYGCTQPAVSLYIQRHVPKETWATVREESIDSRLEQSISEMERAEDQLMLARARESARLWMWRAEREHPHRWGQRPSTQVNVGGSGLQVQIVSYADNNAAQHPPVIDNGSQEQG